MKTGRWAVIVALFMGGAVGFGIATLWWSGTDATLRERLSFAEKKLQIALINPTNLTNPTNFAALVAKKNVTKEKGRSLSDEERTCIVSKFSGQVNTFPAMLISAIPEDEPTAYATDISNLFLRMGFRTGVLRGWSKQPDARGVMVGLKDPDHPSDLAIKFIGWMTDCKLLTHKPIKYDPSRTLLPFAAAMDFDLFIAPAK